MRQYTLTDSSACSARLEILKESKKSLAIRIIRNYGDFERILEEHMSRDLFETCLRTGFIQEIPA